MARLAVILVVLMAGMAVSLYGSIYIGLVPDFTGLIVPATEREDLPPPPPPRVDPVFIDMEPVLIPVIQNGEIKQNVYVSFRLELVPKEGSRSRAYQYRSALRDVYLRALFELVPQQLEERDLVDVAAVKERLMELSLQVLGGDVVKDVVMLAVFYR